MRLAAKNTARRNQAPCRQGTRIASADRPVRPLNGTDAANMLFHVVKERHRRHRSMIFTTNKALNAWAGVVLQDEDLGQAIDRVLERGPPHTPGWAVDPKAVPGA